MNNHLNQETVTTLINPNENIKKTNHMSIRSPNFRIILKVDTNTNWLHCRPERTRDANLFIKCNGLSHRLVQRLLVTRHRAAAGGRDHIDHRVCERLSNLQSKTRHGGQRN